MSTYLDDFPRQLGPLGLTMRLRRLSDRMTHDARRLYRSLGLDIEPNWHAVMLLLRDRPGIGVAEIARRLGMTHPSASVLIGQLVERGFLDAAEDPSDGRRRVLRLSRRAKRRLPRLEAVWEAGGRAIAEALGDGELLAELTAFEDAIASRAYDERTTQALGEAGVALDE